MAVLLGGEVDTWLVFALLMLTLGLTGALLAATRETLTEARRAR
ncbi:MAG TPA: hypothetical protein VFH03_00720 [Actinoplanes sp.]|nr:hypothetical protein [Actinoplanes sp.]